MSNVNSRISNYVKSLESKNEQLEQEIEGLKYAAGLSACAEETLKQKNQRLREVINEIGHYFKQHNNEHYDGDKLKAIAQNKE